MKFAFVRFLEGLGETSGGWKDKTGLGFSNLHSKLTLCIDGTEGKGFLEGISLNYIFIIDPVTSTVHSNSHAATQEQTNWLWSWFGNSQPKTQDLTTTATSGKQLCLLLINCSEC